MPQNYSGSTAGLSGRPTVTISEPVGTDTRNATSVQTPFRKIADLLQYVMTNAAFSAELAAVPAWTDLPLSTGWTGTLKYRKDPLGIVWVKGYVTAGAGATTFISMQALPVGSRPAVGDLITFSAWDGTAPGTPKHGYLLSDGGGNDHVRLGSVATGGVYGFHFCFRAEA
jgi:hypothetical protein